MTESVLQPVDYAYGGSAVARDNDGRPVFIQGAVAGEKVRVFITVDKERFAHAYVTEVLEASAERVIPRCPHFGPCGGCHYQHMAYGEQLRAKHHIVHDQLQRIGGLSNINVAPVLPDKTPWEYNFETVFSPVIGGGLGYWSPRLREVIPISTCPITRPELLALFEDIDLDLPGLRKLTLRLDGEGAMLAALEIEDAEAPELAVDFPLSVALVLPDSTAASLIGEPYLVYPVKERVFRASPGSFFQPNLGMAAELVDVMLDLAALSGTERVLELYSGVGMLTAFLAQQALEVMAIEANSDAVIDMAVNLDDLDNVSLYHGFVEDVLPELAERPDLVVFDPGLNGLTARVIDQIAALSAPRLVYVSSELARMARDGRALAEKGYKLQMVQPLDMRPQSYQVDTVSLWVKPEA
ncbi:MAG: class I SAM-dependent RNA methyltransferase [Candidatus Promineifilaceae bacterium]